MSLLNNCSLYIQGGLGNIYEKFIPLSIFQNEQYPESGLCSLFTFGGATGCFSACTLVMPSGSNSQVQGQMSLFTFAPASGLAGNVSSLFVEGCYQTINDSVSLFVCNSGVASNTTLFIQGDGIQPGALPYHKTMNLFLRRATANAGSLYILGPGTPTAFSANMFVSGINVTSSGMSLIMKNSHGLLSKTVTCYTHGF